MMPRNIFIALLAVALIGTLVYLWRVAPGKQRMPEISLLTVAGKNIELASLRGQPLLVTFWATTCSVCVREIPHLVALYEELSPRGLEIIGIAMYYDPPNQVLAASKARNIPYPVALDITAAAARAFGGVRQTPASFLVAPDGRIVYRKTGEMDMAKVRQKILAMLDSPRASPTDARIRLARTSAYP